MALVGLSANPTRLVFPVKPNMGTRGSQMNTPNIALALSALALAAASFAANAGIAFSNLGTNAPPASIGGYTMTPFDQAPQAAVPGGTSLSVIPCSPFSGNLAVLPATGKRSIGDGWATWSHGYTGVVYSECDSTSAITLTLPQDTGAFYFYAEPNDFGTYNVTATSNSGATSVPIAVAGASGANGFAFYADSGRDHYHHLDHRG